MAELTTIGLDIAKSVFQVHGIDTAGQVLIRRRLRRSHVLKFFSSLPPCLIGIEACATSHHWSRQLQALGHHVKLMPPSYVKPGDNGDELIEPVSPDRRNDAELGHMGAYRVREHRPLAHQHQPDTMQHQNALLLRSLGIHEAHRRPHHRFANRLCVGHVVLLPLDVGGGATITSF
jgi:hypothetical protein